MIQISTAPKGEIRSALGIDLSGFRCGRYRLTRREHQILALLNKQFGCVVPWDRLLDALYSDDEDGGPENARNVLAVCVCTLRRKMLGTGYQIVTVWYEGLMLKHQDYREQELKTGT
jgi:DNA-binding response OmpR family regulator